MWSVGSVGLAESLQDYHSSRFLCAAQHVQHPLLSQSFELLSCCSPIVARP